MVRPTSFTGRFLLTRTKMAGSQLKRLKASLKEQGIIGPQQSKKQKKKNAQDLKARNEKRLQRSEALEGIRQQFNPFEFHMNARGPKFQITTNKPANENIVNAKPALSKSRAEEKVCVYFSPPSRRDPMSN